MWRCWSRAKHIHLTVQSLSFIGQQAFARDASINSDILQLDRERNYS